MIDKTRLAGCLVAVLMLVSVACIGAVSADGTDSADSEIRHATGYVLDENISIPAVVIPPQVQGNLYSQGLQSGSLPDSYDLRDENRVTSVKDQGQYGTCWAFATANAFESNIITHNYESNPNLSEYQLAYFLYNRSGVTNGTVLENLTGLAGDNVRALSGNDYLDFGGNSFKTVNHLSAGIGMAKESDMSAYVYQPYSDTLGSQVIPPSYSEPKTSYVMKGAYYVNPVENPELVKQYLQTYGAGFISYHSPNLAGYHKNSDGQTTCYNSQYSQGNHAVSLVGWNNSIKIENDTSGNPVSLTGAWLIKNSWNESFGDDGYFWLSYDDKSLDLVMFVDVEPAYGTYDTVLQYDGGVYEGYLPIEYLDDGTYLHGGIANNFTITKDLHITDVSFQVNNPNIEYNITIWKNDVNAGSTTGTLTTVGYAKIHLSSPVDTVAGDTVFVSVLLKAPSSTVDIFGNNNISVPFDCSYTYWDYYGAYAETYAACEPDQSYVCYNGYGWYDINKEDDYGNFRIKVFGTEIKSSGTIVPAPSLTGYDKAYTGSAITVAILENSNYTISGNRTETAVGTYTAKVSLNDKDNTSWSTGGTADLSIVWNITNASLTHIVVEQNEPLTYNGSALTANLTTSATTVDSSAVTFTYSTETAGVYAGTVPSFIAAGNHSVNYRASAANHRVASGSFNVTIGKAIPSADNFTASNSSGMVTFPLNVDFNNSEYTVVVTAADGVYGMGEITVIYTNSTSGLEETPKKVGSYYVNISVGAGANYSAISNLHLGDINVNSKSYTITYETNGGSAIADESYNSGISTKSLNTSTEKTGYHLDGWYVDSALTGTKVTQITAEDYGNKTFYAKWLNNTYTVTFDKNNTLATGSMADQSFTYGAAPTALTANAFNLTGYQFANWTNRTDGTGVFYADKEAVQNLNATNEGITTLYAVWEPNTYKVHFEGNGNTSGSMDDQVFTYDGDAVALTANAYQKSGYNFSGWTGNADGTGAFYADGAFVQNLTAEHDGVVTLYAKWTVNQTPREFTKTADEKIILDSGDVVSSINVSGTNIESISFVYDPSVQAPTRSGYHAHKAFGVAFNISVTAGSFTSGKAVVNFNISLSDMAGLPESNVWLAHQKNGVWEYLKAAKTGENSKNKQFSAETTSFSPFYPVYMVQDSQPTYSSSGSTKQTGYTQILSEVPTTTPTVTQTAAPTQAPVTPTINPSASSTTQSTQSSPVPVAGLIAGLGVAALVLARQRK